MLRHALVFGLVGGLLILLLQLVEYRWLVLSHSVEIYVAIVAAIFAGVGIWLGQRITRPRERLVVREVAVPVEVTVEVPVPVEVPVEVTVEVPVPADAPFVRDDRQVAALGLTPRELEILALIAEGLSTREIAERIYLSENTVKTHSSRLFSKLGAQRRTQAVQRGKQLRLIP